MAKFQGKRMVPESLIAILKEMDSKGVSVSDLADMLEAFTDDEIQPTLTAGDNIQITEENVISATDTTYTAGTGINISEDNEISVQKVGTAHSHTIIIQDNQGYLLHMWVKMSNNSTTPLTKDELIALYQGDTNNYHACCAIRGAANSSFNYYNRFFFSSDGTLNLPYQATDTTTSLFTLAKNKWQIEKQDTDE